MAVIFNLKMTSYDHEKRMRHVQDMATGDSRNAIAPGKQTLTSNLAPLEGAPDPTPQRREQPRSQPLQSQQTGLVEDWTDVVFRADLYQGPVFRASAAEVGSMAPPYHGPIQAKPSAAARLPGRAEPDAGLAAGEDKFRAPQPGMWIQRKEANPSRMTDANIHEAASRGIQGSGSRLPHLPAIQKSFGHHDVTQVQAHLSGKAAQANAEIGSTAYTTDNHIAFAQYPDLHTAAHEAAHIVQQRVSISLSGGVGQAGDPYERHADTVADAVVQGKSAETILDRMASTGTNASLQGGSCSGQAEAPGQHHADRVADSAVRRESASVQQSAVQMYTKIPAGKPYDRIADDGKMAVEAHTRNGWADAGLIAKSNDVLAAQKAKAKIKVAGAEIKVKPPGKPTAPDITLKKFAMEDVATGTEVELFDDCGTANQQMLGAKAAGSMEFVAANRRGTTHEFTSAEGYHRDDNAPGGIVSTTEALSGQIYIRIFQREFKKSLSRVDALKEWDNLSPATKEKLSKKYGINQYAVPRLGQGITIGSERDAPGARKGGFNFHFGLALIASGHDYLTLEDFASSGLKYYYAMYGPASKSQSWAEEQNDTGELGNKTTTMVVQHPASLRGKTNTAGVHLVANPTTSANKRLLAKDTEVRILRKGHSWMKVEVLTGPRASEIGWILNRFYTDS